MVAAVVFRVNFKIVKLSVSLILLQESAHLKEERGPPQRPGKVLEIIIIFKYNVETSDEVFLIAYQNIRTVFSMPAVIKQPKDLRELLNGSFQSLSTQLQITNVASSSTLGITVLLCSNFGFNSH